MVGAVHLKFMEPVFPGNQIEFMAELAGELDDYLNYRIEASVGGIKAKGTLSSIKGLGTTNALSLLKKS